MNFWISAKIGWISGIIIAVILITVIMVIFWRHRKNSNAEILTEEKPDYCPARKVSLTGNPTGNIVRPSSYTEGSNLKNTQPAPSCGRSDAEIKVTSPKRRRESFKMINDTLKRFRKLSENQPELHV